MNGANNSNVNWNIIIKKKINGCVNGINKERIIVGIAKNNVPILIYLNTINKYIGKKAKNRAWGVFKKLYIPKYKTNEEINKMFL